MPFGPHIMQHVETALAEGFQYHRELDSFLRRSGVPERRLAAARDRAELHAKASGRFSKAPKRYVAQELLNELSTGLDEDDRLLAGLVTALCRASLPNATQSGRVAVEALIAERLADRKEKEERQRERNEAERERQLGEERIAADLARARDEFRERFLNLNQEPDMQSRGYALERFLSDFFSFEGLNPRASFKIVGEQIDGSFVWSGKTHLVEAKWTSKPVGGAEFSSLLYKIAGKTADTRGLFVSINGYSPQAIQGLHGKGDLRFVCIDGAHLMRAMEIGGSFAKILEAVWRHADETGEAYLPVGAPAFSKRLS